MTGHTAVAAGRRCGSKTAARPRLISITTPRGCRRSITIIPITAAAIIAANAAITRGLLAALNPRVTVVAVQQFRHRDHGQVLAQAEVAGQQPGHLAADVKDYFGRRPLVLNACGSAGSLLLI